MRHIASLLAGLIIAPIAWVLIGAGTIGLDPDGAFQGAEGKPSTAIAIAMLAGAGLLVGLTAVTRWSPAGPLMVAAVFSGCFAVFRFGIPDFMLPASFSAAMIPGESAVVAGRSGTVLAIAGLLATAILIPGRWRSQNDDDDVVDTATLSSSSSTNSAAEDPFESSSSQQQTSLLMGGTPSSGSSPSAGSGYHERGSDPYGDPYGGSSSSGYGSPQAGSGYGAPQAGNGYTAQQYSAEQRSAYADDGYSQDQYGYSRYGDAQQQHADTQYVQQQYGGQYR